MWIEIIGLIIDALALIVSIVALFKVENVEKYISNSIIATREGDKDKTTIKINQNNEINGSNIGKGNTINK